MPVKKITCTCGQGLGSSFLVEMNVKKVLKKLGLDNIEVDHQPTSDISKGSADLYVIAADLYDSVNQLGDTVVLTNIVSLPELEEKLTAYLNEKGML
ncbi:MAG: PTS sugar transporter subunit IIB [Erysipelothrix sp.]|nr:PTS sugar transporter subunit IIB [Erysipelothrix sp.]